MLFAIHLHSAQIAKQVLTRCQVQRMNEQLIGDLFAEAMRRMTGSSSREFSQKFAQLIVQECAGRVDWILAEGGGTQGDLIREHFGVTE
jgi:hypothetical protein